ncbi:MAG: hypothetical protein RLZZ227_112 [Pseudomonadota bacterium]
MTSTPEESPLPKNDQSVEPSKLDFPIVGIGASAGGVSALQVLFESMPKDNGMAYVVILHLSPKHESHLDEILQRKTTMPVVKVKGTVALKREHIYIISPNSQLRMNDGHLYITPHERPMGHHVAIDVFFRTLANVHRERAVAVILSGTGSDGAVGIASVKEQGGIIVVQSPADAEYEGMPQAAIATGLMDFVLPVSEMAQKLISLWRNAQRIELPPLGDGDELQAVTTPISKLAAEDALRKIIALLRAHTGHDFRHYKRATVLRRIERRMQVRSVSSLPAYCRVLADDSSEFSFLLKDMLIGVTNFFRDREAFEALEREIIPQLFKDRHSDDEVRAWSAACSTGEEAYSIAMLLMEQAALLAKPPPIQVFASDIDDNAISVARRGMYPASIIADVTPSRLRQFFTKQENHYQIRKPIRDKVLFASHNLLRDPPFSKIDLISCRNLLIYLNRDVQIQVLEMFHFALKPDGILFLGNSESADVVGDHFLTLDKKNRIYRARPAQRTTRFMTPTSLSSRAAVRTPVASPPNQKQLSYGEIHQRMLLQHGPVSLLVDTDSNIIHMSERAARFLRFTGGEPSRNLLSLVVPELRLELRTALYQAQQTDRLEPRHVTLSRAGEVYDVTIAIYRANEDGGDSDLLLVLLDEELKLAAEPPVSTHSDDVVLQQLEMELQRNKDQLQQTVEQAQVSTEELRATNEELQAINEELRSATEELETSKEELQSVNEELVTVNYELKVKVEETSKANDDLNNLIASTDIATVFVDSAMRIKRFTPRAAEIFSIIPADIGRSLLDLTHVLDYEELATDATATFATLRLVEREVRSIDGRYYIVRLLPYRTTEDKIDGAVMTFFDITRRREAEERVRVGEERMRLVAESTKDYAIMTLDMDGNLTSWNKGAERIFGWTEAEALGKSTAIIFTPEDREKGAHAEEMQRALRDGRAEDERWHIRKDGTRFYCSGVMTPLASNGLFGFAKIARDQTARVQQESKREEALSQEQISRWNAETSSALKDEFLAIMSHELRHPLNLIHINVELLSRLPAVQESSVGSKATAAIRSSVISQAKIIEDLLDLSRLNTGKLALSLGQINLSELVSTIAESSRSAAATTGVQMKIEVTEEPLIVLADSVRLEQVILNLLNNAEKFTPSGGHIIVRVSLDGKEARLDVIDDGVGIAPTQVSGIFDMFSQAGSITNRSKNGLGIGLALVRQIIELHQGHVEAMSEGIGKGARFSVWLPLAENVSNAQDGYSPALAQTVAGLRILIVDDSEDKNFSLKALLEMDGAMVFVAENASEGLELLKREKIDLLISDISMPKMNGYEFIEKVREMNIAIPAIAASGLCREQDIAHSLRSGFSAHIVKPMSFEQLTDVIGSLCRDRDKPARS